MKTLALTMVLWTGLCARGLLADEPPTAVNFATDVKPILASICISCHNSNSLFGNLNLENRDRAFQDRKGGPVIVPGSSAQSRLYQVLTLPPKDKKSMPAVGHKLRKKDVETLRRWIDEGAKWPEGKDGVVPPPPKPKAVGV